MHRIGRTGRAGAAGVAFTLVTGSEDRQLAESGKLIGKQIAPENLTVAPSGREERRDRHERSDRGERSERTEARGERSERPATERREARQDSPARERREGGRERRESTDRSLSYRRASNASKDPLFNAPYVASTNEAEASWEVSPKAPPAHGTHRRSGNIKPKAKIAALLKPAANR